MLSVLKGKKPVVVGRLGGMFPWQRFGLGLVAIGLLSVLASGIGAVGIPPLTVVKIVVSRLPLVDMVQTWPDTWETIMWQLRLPRVTLAAIVGVALAMSGATYQGLFRNPLADPYLIGVASGAGLGATIVLVTGVPETYGGIGVLPVAAFLGAIGAVLLACGVARGSEGLPLTTLILAGVAVAALAGAMTTLLMIQNDPALRPVLSWLLGGFASAQWKHSAVVLVYLVPSTIVMLSYGRVLNVLQLDEAYSTQLGVDVDRAKLMLIGAASLATAVAVAFSGLIGFVGLIAPHAVRLLWGPDHRSLIPMAAIVGAGFLILADLVARTVVSPSDLPVGIVTAFVGAPFFLYLLKRRRNYH